MRSPELRVNREAERFAVGNWVHFAVLVLDLSNWRRYERARHGCQWVVMTLRRLLAGMLLLTGVSVLSWVRADGTNDCPSCCEPIAIEDADDCTGGNHDEALQRYRTNQSRHWRQMMFSSSR
jgi:hypothetical protein